MNSKVFFCTLLVVCCLLMVNVMPAIAAAAFAEEGASRHARSPCDRRECDLNCRALGEAGGRCVGGECECF
ncbi:hypothetical protein ILUMI_00097 [Ignelater luminosus]|uniref:Defensin n=1 Tax=Ignelater luminosus TaxID=2038154 RepID=A0A8K0DKW8_IGNLU|nr:hypothetical protein ILUMI_00097 [Ignelater luminosus]